MFVERYETFIKLLALFISMLRRLQLLDIEIGTSCAKIVGCFIFLKQSAYLKKFTSYC